MCFLFLPINRNLLRSLTLIQRISKITLNLFKWLKYLIALRKLFNIKSFCKNQGGPSVRVDTLPWNLEKPPGVWQLWQKNLEFEKFWKKPGILHKKLWIFNNLTCSVVKYQIFYHINKVFLYSSKVFLLKNTFKVTL